MWESGIGIIENDKEYKFQSSIKCEIMPANLKLLCGHYNEVVNLIIKLAIKP